MDLERVAENVRRGRLVNVEFVSDSGRKTGETKDHPCADARAEGERFAFFRCFARCAHAVEIDRVEDEGDETLLHGRIGDMRVRLVVSPVWTDEQREILAAWAKERDDRLVRGEFERVLE